MKCPVFSHAACDSKVTLGPQQVAVANVGGKVKGLLEGRSNHNTCLVRVKIGLVSNTQFNLNNAHYFHQQRLRRHSV